MITAQNLSQQEKHNCDCIHCQGMCYSSPCIPTSEDVEKMLLRGVPRQTMKFTIFYDVFGKKAYGMVAPLATGASYNNRYFPNACIFIMEGNKCALHTNGLKPTEGKLAIHGRSYLQTIELRVAVCQTWKSKAGQQLIKLFGCADVVAECTKIEEKMKHIDFKEEDVNLLYDTITGK